jgi:hypothetical protein
MLGDMSERARLPKRAESGDDLLRQTRVGVWRDARTHDSAAAPSHA